MASSRLQLAARIQHRLWRLERCHVDATAMLTDVAYAQEVLACCRRGQDAELLAAAAAFEHSIVETAPRRVPGFHSRDLARYNLAPQAHRIHQPPRCSEAWQPPVLKPVQTQGGVAQPAPLRDVHPAPAAAVDEVVVPLWLQAPPPVSPPAPVEDAGVPAADPAVAASEDRATVHDFGRGAGEVKPTAEGSPAWRWWPVPATANQA